MKVPTVDLLRQPRSQGLSSYRPIVRAPRGGKMRDPGNEVAFEDENLKEVACSAGVILQRNAR